MARANAGSVVAVEVLIEQQEVAPVRAGMEDVALSMDRAVTVGRLGERSGEPVADLTSDLEQIELPPRGRLGIRR